MEEYSLNKIEKSKVVKMLKNEDLKKVIKALDLINLTNRERKIIILVDIKGFSQSKTSEVLDCSLRTVHNSRITAIRKIAVIWAKEKII